jgi:DNA-binding NarL/FixJ family response regulator
MLKENRSLHHVCKDDDLPSYQAAWHYARSNKEFRKQLEKTYKQLPYSIQAMAHQLPKAKFQKELVRLQKSGLSMAEISKRLGLSESSVLRRLKYL